MTFVISMTIALTTMGMAMAWSQRPVPSTYAGLIDKKNLVGFAHEAQLELRPDLGRWTETLEDGGLDVYVPLVAPGYAGAAIDLVGRFDEASEHFSLARSASVAATVTLAARRRHDLNARLDALTKGHRLEAAMVVHVGRRDDDYGDVMVMIFFVMAAFMGFKGMRAAEELRADAFIHPEKSELFPMVKFGLFCAAIGLGTLIDTLLRSMNASRDGLLTFAVVVLAAASLPLTNHVARWMGIGVPPTGRRG